MPDVALSVGKRNEAVGGFCVGGSSGLSPNVYAFHLSLPTANHSLLPFILLALVSSVGFCWWGDRTQSVVCPHLSEPLAGPLQMSRNYQYWAEWDLD